MAAVRLFSSRQAVFSFTDSRRTPLAASLSRARTDSSRLQEKYLSFQATTWSNGGFSLVASGHHSLELFATHGVVAVPCCHVESPVFAETLGFRHLRLAVCALRGRPCVGLHVDCCSFERRPLHSFDSLLGILGRGSGPVVPASSPGGVRHSPPGPDFIFRCRWWILKRLLSSIVPVPGVEAWDGGLASCLCREHQDPGNPPAVSVKCRTSSGCILRPRTLCSR